MCMNTDLTHETKRLIPDSSVGDMPAGVGGYDWEIPLVYGCEITSRRERRSPDVVGSRTSWKDFQHYKMLVGSSSGSTSMVDRCAFTGVPYVYDVFATVSYSQPYAFYGGQFGELGVFNDGLPPYVVLGEETDQVVYLPSKIQELVAKGVQALLPTLRPDVSLVNSLIELKDVATARRSLDKAMGLVKGINKLLGQSGSKATLRDLLRFASKSLHSSLTSFEKKGVKWVSWQGAKVLADIYLQKKFNVDPLIADIKAVYSAVSTSEKRLRRLLNRAGSPQVGHYTYKFEEFGDTFEVASNGVGISNPFTGFRTHLSPINWERFVINKPTTFHAEMQYSYSLSHFQLAHAQALGLLDQLGVNFNPAIIWNALPWSFVVDWVLGVSTYLNTLRIGNMDPVLNIHQFLYSVSRERTILVTRETGTSGNPVALKLNRSSCPAVFESSYRRVVGIPDAAYFRVSGLSSTEVKLGAALAVSLHQPFRKHH